MDLLQAYKQVLLEETSRELVTVNTHKGLYRYTRLTFGVATAPAIFQRTMDVVLQGLSNVMCYLDDIIISGTSDAEHLELLSKGPRSPSSPWFSIVTGQVCIPGRLSGVPGIPH